MATLKRSAYIFVALLGTVLNPACITAAFAATTDLVCSQTSVNYKFYVSIDFSAQSVVAWLSTNNRSDSPSVSAHITDDTVTWTLVSGAGTTSFTLDRNTGAMNIVRPEGRNDAWICIKSSRVF